MEDKKLQSALYYLNHCNFSVIPCKEDKRPWIKWEQYQKEKPTEAQVKEWWGKQFRFANIGIVTGAISGLTVLDVDTNAGMEKLNDLLPDSWLTPTVDTPGKGTHFYCKYEAGVSNAVRFMEGCDIRSEGGYIMAPPSSDHRGAWKWREECKITNIALNAVPEKVLALITSFSSSSSLLLSSSSSFSLYPRVDNSNAYINFEIGSRDNTIFHIANCLTKGGMPEQELEQVLGFIGDHCNPPFPRKDLLEKIKSALKRKDATERNLTAEVKEWVLSTRGHFQSTEVHKELGLSTRVHMKNVSMILSRLCEQGIIEKYGDKRGSFRLIDRSFVEQQWWNDSGQPLPVKFPLGIDEFVKIFPGNIVLLEGQKSQGKSAFALEFCRMNKGLFSSKILYQNVEMADSELLDRFRAYGDVMSIDDWKQMVTFIKQTGEWWDKILPDGLNVVDYLIEYKEPWQLAQYVFNIHQKLKSGIALVIVQRDPFKPYPTGGRGVRDIPRAIISLIKHKVRLEDVKSYYQTAYGNPTGLCRKYKQVNWWNLRPDSGWEQEEEEKYAGFKK